jgi:hypothetical protein
MPNSTNANPALSETDKTPRQKFENMISDPKLFNGLFGELIDRIQTEIRYRHYAIRTEHTYSSLIKGFLNFHKLRPDDF